MMNTDIIYQIALLKIVGVGPIVCRKLMSYFQSAENIFKAKKDDFLEFCPNNELFYKLKSADQIIKIAENEILYCSNNDISIISFNDENYPKKLKNCIDAPQVLFFKGNVPLNNNRIVSIVGTRKCTPYGIDFCKMLCSELEPYNVVIVSGLAHGIDFHAHSCALENNISTFAVLGHGLNHVYPAINKKLAKKILTNGALISEFHHNELPDKFTFPKRNRIIAGISDATIVLESPEKGGAMITARIANSYNKEVFALPGDIKSNASIGCNTLIKNQEAHLINSPEDVIKMLSWETMHNRSKKTNELKKTLMNLNSLEKQVVSSIEKNEYFSINDICRGLNMKINDLGATITLLELKGIIHHLPGKIFRINK